MKRNIHDVPCCDHKGNIYGNIKSMCRAWNIKPETFDRRMKIYGMTLEEALTKPVKGNGGYKCSDYYGKQFRSVTSMCKYWGISRKVYSYRMSHGWTQEEALTIPAKGKRE